LILLQRLTQIIQVWCAEFDRTDDADTRRDHIREVSSKRRSDKRAKDEKVCDSRVRRLNVVDSSLAV
jgi:dynein heavy chain 1